MDCLIDQLGQSKKAKQGPLKVRIIQEEKPETKNYNWKNTIKNQDFNKKI